MGQRYNIFHRQEMRGEHFKRERRSLGLSNQISIDEQTRKTVINVYQYSRLNKAKHIKQEIKYNLLSILCVLLLVSVVLFIAVFSLKYLIESTKIYGNMEHCHQSEIEFNGWAYSYKCAKCEQGFSYEQLYFKCVPEH